MARYGQFKYKGAKYGAVATSNLLWSVEVDWDNDSYFDGSSEAGRLLSISLSRGRDGQFSAGGDGSAKLQRMQTGQCTIKLDNYDRRFDPWYTSSPLYPNVQPGRGVRIRVKNGNTGSVYGVFLGRIDDIQSGKPITDPTCTLVISDGWRMLADRDATVALQTDVTIDQLMSAVLTDVEWPTAWGSSLDVGSDVVPYAWVDSQSAFDALHDMSESEMGLVYVGGDGKFYFLSRHTLLLAASSLTLDQAEILNEPDLSNPWDFIKNKIAVKAYPRKLGALGEIYRLDEIPLFAPGQSRTIWGTFKDTNYNTTIAQDVATPIATTDYTMNTTADGLGTDQTASFSVTASIFAGSVKLVVTNSGAVEAYVTLLRVRGKPLELLNVSASISEDSASQTTYGKRQMTLELPFQQQVAVAVDMSDWLISWMKDPLPVAIVEIVNRPTIQFAYDIGTTLTLTAAYYGISHRFRIGKVRHESLESMQGIKTIWTLEPVDQQTAFWQLGVTGFDELGVATRLAY